MKQTLPAITLAISGILITLVSAFFSIHGFLLFLPEPSLFLGILGLGIAFELAKIVCSTFLFHRMKDKTFPLLFKIYLLFAVISLVAFSAIFTFVHLNSAISANLSSINNNTEQVLQLKERNKVIQESILNMDKQIASLPPDMVRNRIKLIDQFKPEKDKLTNELSTNTKTINDLQKTTISNDKFVFLNTLSNITGISKDHIFTYVILFIVITIDPLAISVFLASSHIFASIKSEPIKKDNIEERIEYLTNEEVIEENIIHFSPSILNKEDSIPEEVKEIVEIPIPDIIQEEDNEIDYLDKLGSLERRTIQIPKKK